MAYDITGLTGTTIAPDADHPMGYLKNAPSGTIATAEMLADIWQVFQLLMQDAAFTFSNSPDITGNFQLYDALKAVNLFAPSYEIVVYENDFANGAGSTAYPPGYSKDHQGQLLLRGFVTSTVATNMNGLTMFTLPTGYRPTKGCSVVAFASTGVAFEPIWITIEPTGEVKPFVFTGSTILTNLNSGGLSLDGICIPLS